ncbi:MAG TPA: DeoR/GlpR family DNA-binding transcription regulator [Gaiellaceae bacterium]|jgi:DeoR/GlpR family transcriptional regulator of sugar metabolism|nr:DeoR/GlpR family DNA-binding transcription regulator [Gaiellaceae bacterium]
MLPAERRRLILERLRRDGRVVAAELGGSLGVSHDTVRRDLQDLAEAGLLQRVHGGALPPVTLAPSFAARRRDAPAAKLALARAGANLIRPGQVVILDAGTTNERLASELPPELEATIFTNAPPVAIALARQPHIDVHLLGGRLDKAGLAAVGSATVAAVRDVRADVCVLGICSVHPGLGISGDDSEEAYLKRAMIESAADVVGLATADKLGTSSPFVIAPPTELTHLIVDRAATEEAVAPYEAIGITVVRA